MNRWRVYYGDGSAHSGEGVPTDVLISGVICVVQRDRNSGERHVLSGHDWYWYDLQHRQWFGGDLQGLIDFVTRMGVVKQGRFIPNVDFDRIIQQARTDPDFSSPIGREHGRTSRDSETR